MPHKHIWSHAHGTLLMKHAVLWPVIVGETKVSPTSKPKQKMYSRNIGVFIKNKKKRKKLISLRYGNTALVGEHVVVLVAFGYFVCCVNIA